MSAPDPAAQRAKSAQPGVQPGEKGAQPDDASGARPLLVLVDPGARGKDGESVRIAKDVLSAGTPSVKLCLPDGPEEFARALARRGARRPVVIGDDRALLRAVTQLHRERDLDGAPLSVVPVGPSTELVRGLGVPASPVDAARAVLDGVPHRLDLLVDDSDGVVLGDLRLPVRPGDERDARPRDARARDARAGDGFGRPGGRGDHGDRSDGRQPGGRGHGHAGGDGPGGGHGFGDSGFGGGGPSGRGTGSPGSGSGAGRAADGPGDAVADGPWWGPPLRTAQSLFQSLTARAAALGGLDGLRPTRLRVEADGETLVDLDRPVGLVSVTAGGARSGYLRVEVRPAGPGTQEPVAHAVARSLTISGTDFHYRADTITAGPVRRRTWTVHPGAWTLTLPRE